MAEGLERVRVSAAELRDMVAAQARAAAAGGRGKGWQEPVGWWRELGESALGLSSPIGGTCPGVGWAPQLRRPAWAGVSVGAGAEALLCWVRVVPDTVVVAVRPNKRWDLGNKGSWQPTRRPRRATAAGAALPGVRSVPAHPRELSAVFRPEPLVTVAFVWLKFGGTGCWESLVVGKS